jgi:hypothetical protein
LITTLYVPKGVDDETATVIVAEPEPGALIEAGLNVAVALDGSPEADNATLALNGPDKSGRYT